MQSVMSQPRMNSGLVPGQAPRAAVTPNNGMFVLTSRFLIINPKVGLKAPQANTPLAAKPAPLRAKPAATKKQSQPKKAVIKKADGKGSVSSASDSYESDDSLEIQEPEEPSPLPPARPNDPEAAAQYDALRAVWSPRNRRPKVDKVKNALVAFKDVVKSLRDTWKESAQALKTAENKGESSNTTELRKQVALQRRLMDVVVSTTLAKGHPIIVEKYVNFLFLFLCFAYLAYPCHSHRSQKEIERTSHVISLIWLLSCYKESLYNKGELLTLYSVAIAFSWL